MPNNSATINRVFMFSLIGPSGRGSSFGAGGGSEEYICVPVSRSRVCRAVFFMLIFIFFRDRSLGLVIVEFLIFKKFENFLKLDLQSY